MQLYLYLRILSSRHIFCPMPDLYRSPHSAQCH